MIRNHFIEDLKKNLPDVLASMLCLRTVQPLDPDHLATVSDRQPRTSWDKRRTTHSITINIHLEQFLLQHILQEGEIVDQKLCGWFGVSTPPWEVLLGYKFDFKVIFWCLSCIEIFGSCVIGLLGSPDAILLFMLLLFVYLNWCLDIWV